MKACRTKVIDKVEKDTKISTSRLQSQDFYYILFFQTLFVRAVDLYLGRG